MTDSDWLNPRRQLDLFGLEKARQLALTAASPVEQQQRLARLDVAHDVLSSLPTSEELSFLHSALAQTFLPHARLSNNQAIWTRHSGRLSLIVRPGLVENRPAQSRRAKPTSAEQEAMHVGVPYGAKARLILMHVQSEAVARGREVQLGGNLTTWLRSLGVTPSSGPRGSIAAVREQALRISRCLFTIQFDRTTADGEHISSLRDFSIAEDLELVAKAGEVWPRSILLDNRFFEHLREHAVPLDRRAIAHIAGNSLGLDLYALFAYRLPRLKANLQLRWDQLAAQLGASQAETKGLARRIRTVLPDVIAGYPEAKIEIMRHGLLLMPSRPSIPSTQVRGFRVLEGGR